ncbi:MAG TPA: PaaI family thioesterase [Dehalococcoidia bacterium]|nr:PaaI family thioesterase [Dehalococcoidia bacterium]
MRQEGLSPEYVGRLAKVVELAPFMRQLGMRLEEAGPGYARIALPFRPENTTGGGVLHGGAIASLMDTAGAIAAWTMAEMGSPRYSGSTVSITVNYLAPAANQGVAAEARLLRRGRELFYLEVRVTGEGGSLLAQGSVIYRIVEREG